MLEEFAVDRESETIAQDRRWQFYLGLKWNKNSVAFSLSCPLLGNVVMAHPRPTWLPLSCWISVF